VKGIPGEGPGPQVSWPDPVPGSSLPDCLGLTADVVGRCRLRKCTNRAVGAVDHPGRPHEERTPLCLDHLAIVFLELIDEPTKRPESVERSETVCRASPAGEREAGGSVQGAPPRRSAENGRRCGRGGGADRCGPTVSCTCVKVTPECCCTGASESEALELGVSHE
jgi:hypothetical protein